MQEKLEQYLNNLMEKLFQ